MKILTNEEIKKSITYEEAFEWASNVIKHKKEAVLPAKISMPIENNGFYNVMPCILPSFDVAGVKVVNRYPEHKPVLKSNLMLYNLKDGNLKALMDADYITTIRTGAVAAHSMLLFAKSDYKTIALIGLGNVCTMAIRVFLKKYDGRKLTIKLFKFNNDAEIFIEKFKDYQNIKFIVCDNYNDLMQDSDIIVSGIAYAGENFCDEKYYKKGCTVIPIHTRGFQNCDTVFDKVFGDDTGHICGFKYFNEFKRFSEVCDVVNEIKVGRDNDEERILVYNIGIALHDIYFANQVYHKIYE